MEITLNGERQPLAPSTTVAALLASHGMAERRVAVEINGEIIPRSRHDTHPVQEGDQIEIVHALGGG